MTWELQNFIFLSLITASQSWQTYKQDKEQLITLYLSFSFDCLLFSLFILVPLSWVESSRVGLEITMRDSSCSITAFLAIACIQLTLFRFIILHNGPNQSRAERSERREGETLGSVWKIHSAIKCGVSFEFLLIRSFSSLSSTRFGSVRFS